MAATAQDLDRLSGDLQVIGSGTSALRRRLAKQKEQLQELRSALARMQDELNEISAGLRAPQREPDDLLRGAHVHGCISPYLRHRRRPGTAPQHGLTQRRGPGPRAVSVVDPSVPW
ncbi:hypothetical protein ACFY4B_17650 [Kitasatospora sp. NPDC001261]|uniref:hypothetical protein n=1 Tax=Kitasatospora sp. NPDC001261 TaxID=3364012 RepID=UPI00369644DF